MTKTFPEPGPVVPVQGTPRLLRMPPATPTRLPADEEHQLQITQDALEQISDGVIWAELSGRLVYANEAACRVFGYSREELLAMQIFDLAPKPDRQEWRERWRKLRAGGSLVYQFRRRTPAGKLLPIEITVNYVLSGGQERVFAWVRDNGALQGVQQALRARERRYREFISHSAEAVWCFEFREPIPTKLGIQDLLRAIYRTAYVSECNNAFARLRGFSNSDEATGKPLRDFVKPAEWRRFEQGLKRAPRGSIECEEPSYEGGARCFLLNYTAIIEEGFVRQVWGTTVEITGRRPVADTFQESDRRLRELLEAVDLLAVMLDAQGRITFCNDQMSRVTGWSREELLGQDWFVQCVPEQDRERERSLFTAPGSVSGLPRHYESPMLTRDGQRRLIAWDNARLGNGTFLGTASLGTDVTDRHAIEEQNRQSQRMESVGRLAGGVAHDFNNLLTVINAYSELLLENMDETDPGRVNLVEIRKAGDRAAALTHQLLAVSRRQVLNPRILDLNVLVADAEVIIRRAVSEDIEVIARLDPSLRHVRADASQLNQVLLNLVVNARDAMTSGGKLTIATSNVTAGPEIPLPLGPYVLLTVTDDGAGMSADDLAHVFEPFFTTKGPGRGTGLGLSTVYGIVQQSRGHLRVDSEPGRGARFSVYLPAADGEIPVRTYAPVVVNRAPGTETVLVVEDESEVRRAAVGILKSLGYRVLSAASGQEALALVDDSIQLIVTDIVMPGISGRELAEHVRRTRPKIRILYMSGYAYHTDSNMASFPRKEEAYIQKPFTPATLTAKVREALDNAG